MPNLPMPEGLTDKELECVMLDIPPFKFMDRGWDGKIPIEDLFYGKVPQLEYAQGLVGQRNAHVTLMFGIHPSVSYVRAVTEALAPWDPEPIELERITSFPSTVAGQDYSVIVASVVETTNLLEGRTLIEQLDYTDRFETYRPHVTLAYVNASVDVHEWIDNLSWILEGRTYPVTLNLGLD